MKRAVCLVMLLPIVACAQLRVATWNITNYAGGRISALQTAAFASFEGRSLAPDVLVCQEITSASAQAALLGALNSAPGSSGTWAAAPFTDGNDTDNAFFFREDRLQLVGATIIATGGLPPKPPRDTKRYDVVLRGYGAIAPKLAVYSAHMKAGQASDDEARRLAEALAIRNDAQSLTGFAGFAVVGDFNTYTSSDDAFVKLTGSEANNLGRLQDPIATPGSWDGSAAFRFVHTQDPATTSGMNSRFDFVLLGTGLCDGAGFDYLGNPGVAYSTITWSDPAHSYRAWGNDGTSFGSPLTVAGNEMVGAAIAQAIKDVATTTGGHVPVFLDLRVPAEMGVSSSTLDFGTAVVGSNPGRNITISNVTDTLLWRTGIADLLYTFSPSSGFSAPAGTFFDVAGGEGQTHSITMDTSTPGVKSGSLFVSSPVAGTNSKSVSMTGQVVPDELFADTLSVVQGALFSGGLAQLQLSDDQYAAFQTSSAQLGQGGALSVELGATSPVPTIGQMTLIFESKASGTVTQAIDAFDFAAGRFVNVSRTGVGPIDQTVQVTPPSPNRFIEPGTGQLRLRFSLTRSLTQGAQRITFRVDKVAWVLR